MAIGKNKNHLFSTHLRGSSNNVQHFDKGDLPPTGNVEQHLSHSKPSPVLNKYRTNKRGMFFTIIAILLMGLVLFVIATNSLKTYSEESFVTRVRLNTMKEFVDDFERDLDRVLYITGFRAILSIEENIITTGAFIEDSESALIEALLNGTINNQDAGLMGNSTLSQWLARVEQRAKPMGITIDAKINKITPLHRDAWHVDLDISIIFNISDNKGTARWEKEHISTVKIPIDGFEDPFYIIFSYGLLSNIITKTNITDFVDDATNDTTNLQMHLNNSYYVESPDAPSFLMRLSGNFSSSPYGIESLVNLNEFIEQGIPVNTRSSVDYIYFSDIEHTANRIKGMSDTGKWSWFRLDTGSLARYECQDLVIGP